MGYNTVAVILNDRLGDLERDSGSGAEIARAARSWTARDCCPGIENFRYGGIISQDHADGFQVTVVHGNCGWRIDRSEYDKYLGISALRQMKECLERNGYRVIKRRKLR